MYKIACIRELLPRIFLDIAVLKSYRFLVPAEEYPAIIDRIGSTIRGLSNPVVSSYARSYLIAISREVFHSLGDPSFPPATCAWSPLSLAEDTLISLSSIRSPNFVAMLKKNRMTQGRCLVVLRPALDWIMSAAAKHCSEVETFRQLLLLYRDHADYAVVLNAIVTHFDVTLFADAVSDLLLLIHGAQYLSEDSQISECEVLGSLGARVASIHLRSEEKLSVLNDVWKVVRKANDLTTFLLSASAWIKVTLSQCTDRETTVLLKELTARLGAESRLMNGAETLSEEAEKELDSLLLQIARVSLCPDPITGSCSSLLGAGFVNTILESFPKLRQIELCRVRNIQYFSFIRTNEYFTFHLARNWWNFLTRCRPPLTR